MFVIDDQVGQGARVGAQADISPAAAPRGQRLASLDACDLRDRFYSWRGASGRRHVCSVFGIEEEAIVAEFSRALVIGVAREGTTRRPVCVLSSRDFEGAEGRMIRADARALGGNEWHVHFSAEDDDILRGLAVALLN